MSLLHYLRRVVCFLLIYAMGVAVAYANYYWQNFKTLLENGQYVTAIEQLDSHLESSRARHNDQEWTLALLRGAKIRTLAQQQGSAINYLIYSQWPSNQLSQSILNLALAREYAAYSIQQRTKAFLKPIIGKSPDESTGAKSQELFDKINHHYELAYEIAYKNKLLRKQAQVYLTSGDYPTTVRTNLSDVIAAYWLRFLANDMYWSGLQKQLVGSFKIAELLNLRNPGFSKIGHPLITIKKMTSKFIQEHKRLGKQEDVFEAKRFYAQLLTHHFHNDEDMAQLSSFLSDQLGQLGSQYPWWTMGQFQLAMLQQRRQAPSLTHIHDLAVQASLIHPDSLGAIKSRELIDQLEYSEYKITGVQTSDLNQASINIKFRNLQKLYFKGWRTSQPEPNQPNDIARLLTQKPDKEWSVPLPDRFDLRKQSIHHSPPIDSYGQWLIVASPNNNFLDENSELQLLSMQFSQYVTSVNYFNNEFKVSVYQSKNGLPKYNVVVQLLKIENGNEIVLSAKATDRKGNVVLRRKADADYFTIRVGRGRDSSIIDIPSLLPMSDEMFWSKHQAKSLLITDKDAYVQGDTLYWSTITRAAETEKSLGIRANANKKAWLRIFDQANKLLYETHYITDASGSASGNISLPHKNKSLSSPTLIRVQTSWGGKKPLVILPKIHQVNDDTHEFPSIQLLPLSDSYHAGEAFSVEGKAGGCKHSIHWSLKRSSSSLDGALQSYLEIDSGSLSPSDSGKFFFKTQLLLGKDRTHQLRHSFILNVECHNKNSQKASATQTLFLSDQKSYYSVLNGQNFFVEGESTALNILRSNIRSVEQKGESECYIYERLPSTTTTWMRGGIKQTGVSSHNTKGIAALTLDQLESGLYRLRINPKGAKKQAAFEYDFIIAEAGVSKNLKLSSLLLTEKTEFDVNNPQLRLLAGSGNNKQWSRLTITRNKKQLASQMLSPGIHLLTFPINETHQGGVNFLLEWVGKQGIAQREVNLEIPWFKKQLAIKITKDDVSLRKRSRVKV